MMVSLTGCGGATLVDIATASPPIVPASSELIHEFGVVSPGSVHESQFVVENNSDRVRRLVRIQQGCACIAATPEKPLIAPRGTLTVSVTYRAGETFGGDRRRVSLFFDGETAPVDLIVQANIRKPLTCTPRSVDAPQSTGVPPVFVVSNFSDADWDGLEFSGPKWLEFDAILLPSTQTRTPEAPRQAWRVCPVMLPTSSELCGRGVESIAVTAKGRPEYNDGILFGWDHRALLEAVPDRLHLGHVRKGDCIERRAGLRLRREAAASTPEIVDVVPSIPGLKLRVAGRSGDWRLQAVFTASAPGPFETRVRIAAAGAEEIEVPITGIVFAAAAQEEEASP